MIIAVSYTAGFFVEFIFAVVRKHKIHEGFLVTGLIFPLVLPPTTPLWVVAVGVMFGVLFGKEMFGGTGRNIFNPALVGRFDKHCLCSSAQVGDAHSRQRER